jgi:hypothetical protein
MPASAAPAQRKQSTYLTVETAMDSNILIKPYKDGWDVIREGARYAESHHETQEKAIAAGAVQARRESVELVIHGRDGTICARNSFSHAPACVPG